MGRASAKALLIVASFLLLNAALVLAAPIGPDTVTASTPERRSDKANGTLIQAEAGNVTQLVISSTRLTQNWQGYYGNVTGTITLDDANNNTLYDWALATPQGEIYASNGTVVSWSDVVCVNLTGNMSLGSSINESSLEAYYSINRSDKDGFKETFNDTYTSSTGFLAGTVLINDADACPLTYTYVNEVYQTANFSQVLLTDNASIVYTALLNDSADSFKAGVNPVDFQMLVAENGRDPTVTSYYFFVELE